MKNPFKNTKPHMHMDEDIGLPWIITIFPTSETEVHSMHKRISMEESIVILRAVLADYERQQSEEAEKEA